VLLKLNVLNAMGDAVCFVYIAMPCCQILLNYIKLKGSTSPTVLPCGALLLAVK
jgi:hypothetical protein